MKNEVVDLDMEEKNREEKKNDVDFAIFERDDLCKIEANKTYEVGFAGIRNTEIEVQDRQTGERVKKPALELDVDYLNGEKVQKKLHITSKNFIAQIKILYTQNLLFNTIFQITRQGEGYATKYFIVAIKKKENKEK